MVVDLLHTRTQLPSASPHLILLLISAERFQLSGMAVYLPLAPGGIPRFFELMSI